MSVNRPLPQDFNSCMQNSELIRNVCILAHVDHGKTTVADSLLATNRIISKRMVGDIRYLDDRRDEQERGITMKSSAISLMNQICDDRNNETKTLLLNLIDTPGHIDFTSEVEAALKLCDGALIIVDLVEGVCVQTREAIKLSFEEKCKMILILNKIDRLIIELGEEINEIFQRILHAIENCNAIIAELYQYEYNNLDIDIENSGLLFSPDKGNVIFASAVDGWGFTTYQISKTFIKLIEDETIDTLNEKLWNFDAYVDSKKKIKLGAIEKNKTNLFIKLVLDTIFYVYKTIYINMERDKIDLILKRLMITNITNDMKHKDRKIVLRAILQAWKPLSETILLQCMKLIPAPSSINQNKIESLLNFDRFFQDKYQNKCLEEIVNCLKICSSNHSTIIAYISKMFCVNKSNLSQNKAKLFIPKPRNLIKSETVSEIKENKSITNNIATENFVTIALARIFSGTIKVGQELYILPSNYLPEINKTNENIQLIEIKELYILFGRDLLLVDAVAAGNICGIGGLESTVVRTATLSNTLTCVPFIENISMPVVRNSIEPVNPKDLPILRRGLKMLMQSDSCVQVVTQETGEHVLLTAGDVHLGKCLEDLATKFSKISVNVSDPMVSLRETLINPTKRYDFRDDLDNIITIEMSPFSVTFLVVSLPEIIAKEIEKNYKLLHFIEQHEKLSGYELFLKRQNNSNLFENSKDKSFVGNFTNTSFNHLIKHLKTAFINSWSNLFNNIWSINKFNDNINLLINYTDNYKRNIFTTLNENDERSCYDHYIVNAFNTFCKAGPICEEPITYCAVIIKKFDLTSNQIPDSNCKVNFELALRSGFRKGFEKQQQRLMEPMFTSYIQVNTNILGKVYSVIHRRHGKVLDAVGMDEQEKTFLVKAQIPVIESTGFVNEIRKTTSGQAIPSLKFSHFEIIDGDPYYEPADDDEDDESINIEASNKAANIRREVRKRKGLQVDEQVVVHAEKQRTLNKKK